MAEFLWTFAVQEVLKKVLKLAAEQIGLGWGLEKELSNLTNSLLKAEAILADINRKKLNHESVRLWVEDLQHVVHEADDLLDELVYEDIRREVEQGVMKKVRNSISPSRNRIIFRHKMTKRVRDIIETLRKCYSEASPLGLVEEEFRGVENNDLTQIRETISKLDDFEVVGRENEVSNMVKQIIDGSNQQVMSIIPIVGMGGIGKTTLAKMVFNHAVVKKHFDQTIWVCVSESFLINKILEAILQTLKGTSSGMDNKETLVRELQKEMQGKKYFLVLDDVWNENFSLWNELKYCLLSINGKCGISIIVTTRSDEVAQIMETLPRHHLGRLSDDQCWSLFKESASANGLPMTSNLEDIREKLVKRIGGIPLVARILGAALKFEGVYQKWMVTLESVIDIPLQDEDDLMLSILKLSVDHLPSSSLKQCFAYCSKFSKDFKFQKEELIQMWVAQGFIQLPEGRNNIEIEDMGDKYLNILLSRSLFQEVIKDDRGRITHFKMHDLIHDIARTISNSQNELDINRSRKSSRKLLRTLCCDRQMLHETIHDKIANYVCLRVLVVNSSINNLPNSIGKLKHIRYLDVSNCEIEELPHSITKLYNLQILKLGSSIKDLPKNLRFMVNLRHLKFSIPFTEKTKQMPPHLSQLTQLQTLSGFVVGFEEGCKIEELGPLKNLKGRLQLSNLEQVKSTEEAGEAKLIEKKNLSELFFEWSLHPERDSMRFNDFEVLEGLQPHKNLRFLSIENFAGKLLPGSIFVEKLVVIHLRYCRRCERLPMLGQLPNLEELKISSLHHVRNIGNEFYGNNTNQRALFPKLKKFILSQMHDLKQWEEVASNVIIFPHLEDLHVRGCPNLVSIPSIFGSPRDDGVKSLRTLHIRGCYKLTKLPNGLQFCSSIEDLRIIGCPDLSLNVQNMHELCILFIDGLRKLPEALGHLNNLKEMDIIGRIQDYDFSLLVKLPSLVKLELTNYLGSAIQQLPQQLEHLTTLETLTLGNFSDIEALPEWLGNLASLKTLGLYYCRNLKQLPSKTAMLQLTKLDRLYVYGCPQLQLGEDDSKLVKLSYISIN